MARYIGFGMMTRVGIMGMVITMNMLILRGMHAKGIFRLTEMKRQEGHCGLAILGILGMVILVEVQYLRI